MVDLIQEFYVLFKNMLNTIKNIMYPKLMKCWISDALEFN